MLARGRGSVEANQSELPTTTTTYAGQIRNWGLRHRRAIRRPVIEAIDAVIARRISNAGVRSRTGPRSRTSFIVDAKAARPAAIGTGPSFGHRKSREAATRLSNVSVFTRDQLGHLALKAIAT